MGAAVLIIFNCRTIYNHDFGDLVLTLQERPEITVAVCGNMDDVKSGKLDNAKAIFQTENYEICAVANTLSNLTMIRLLAIRFDKEPEGIIVVSDDERDRLAADAFGCGFLPPEEMFQHLVKSE